MDINYYEKFFINPGIEYGIRNYLAWKDGKEYNRIHTFEMYVIKALTIIYGEKSILLPYKIDNERAFECNLLMYDLKENDMKNFIKYMNDYYYFMKEFASARKATGLINEIEKIIIQMITKRNQRKEFSETDIQEFDKVFNPTGDLKKIKNLLSTDNGLITKEWMNSKTELSNTQLRMIAVNPHLLSRDTYEKFGFDIRTVAVLSDLEIQNINEKIANEQNKVNKTGKILKKNKLVFSTGNGFVDKLMLLSIMATEVMIGLIIFSTMR